MAEDVRVNGRELSPAILSRIRAEVARRPELSRTELARLVCGWLGWNGHDGKPQVTGCRIALSRLGSRGVIALPEAKGEVPHRAPSIPEEPHRSPLHGSLDALGEIRAVVVTRADPTLNEAWNGLMAHHYLGAGPLVGRQVRYLFASDQGWLGAAAFSAAAWSVAARDEWIGWSRTARDANRQLIVGNSRFFIAPWVQVAHLASKLLALCARQLPADWQESYGYAPVLLETYVEHERFKGTCYRAANWKHVGQTCGRGRQDRNKRHAVPIKDVYLLPLDSDWRSTLCREPGPRPSRVAQPVDWAEEEFGGASVGDARLGQRLLQMAREFYAHPTSSIPQACEGNAAKAKAAYRWLANKRVNLTAILQPHYEATTRRIKDEKVILAVQDTTFLNYSTHPALEGAGPIGSYGTNTTMGIVLHDTMAFTETGVPLGLVDIQVWARDPDKFGQSRKKRDPRPIEEKESMKWLRSYEAATAVQELCPNTKVISVGDREADIYELFAAARKRAGNPELLIRAEYSRGVNEEQPYLWPHVVNHPVCDTVLLQVARTKTTKERTATLELRYVAVELRPPAEKKRLGPIGLWVVHVREIGAPDEVKPIEWMLLTTIEVDTCDTAHRVLRWYGKRWGIETFHKVLKSGCRIEERQLSTVARIENCLAIDLVVAWRIQHLTMLGREAPELPCTAFFEDHQWKALYAFIHRDPNAVPKQPPSLREAMRVCARLGGFLGRKGDGEPGVKALWIGLQRLDDISLAWLAFRPRESSPNDDTS